ncbi:MAG: hypothetical protein QW835_00045 [Candidatus Hadarchaeum sp.]
MSSKTVERNIATFRQRQFAKIDDLLIQSINYLSSKLDGFLEIKKFEKNEDRNRVYNGIYQSELITYRVTTFNCIDGEDQVFEIVIPKLIDGNYFIIYGIHYVPEVSLVDFPITVIPGRSLRVYGLFNSLIILFDGRVLVGGESVNLLSFLKFVVRDTRLIDEFMKKFGFRQDELSEENFVNFLEQKFGKKDETLVQDLYGLLFDPYTAALYKACYDRDFFSLEELLSFALSLALEDSVYLKHKRIAWVEMLLRDFFHRIGTTAGRLMKGIYTAFRFKKETILKNLKLIHYDSSNLFPASIISRVSRPDKTLAAELDEIHRGVICPVTVSSQDVGKVLTVSPEIVVDDFGVFRH